MDQAMEIPNVEKCECVDADKLWTHDSLEAYIECAQCEPQTIVDIHTFYRSSIIYKYLETRIITYYYWHNIAVESAFFSSTDAVNQELPEKCSFLVGMINLTINNIGHQLCYLAINKLRKLYIFDPNGGVLDIYGNINYNRVHAFHAVIAGIKREVPYLRDFEMHYPRRAPSLQSRDASYFKKGQCTLWADSIIYYMLSSADRSLDMIEKSDFALGDADKLIANYVEYMIVGKAKGDVVRVINGTNAWLLSLKK